MPRRPRTPEEFTHLAIRQRCHNKNNPSYAYYGGRGIRVCDRWLHSRADFLADMGPRPPGHSIDRIDNSRGYEPGNCRWVDGKTQQANTRRAMRIALSGETLCMSECARRLGVSKSTIGGRIRRGMSPEEAVAKPIVKRKRLQEKAKAEAKGKVA